MKLGLACVSLGLSEGQMGLLRTVILGRKNGFRAGLLERVLGDSASPQNDSAAGRTAAPPVAVGEQSLSLGLELPKTSLLPRGLKWFSTRMPCRKESWWRSLSVERRLQ